jgi:hypothetical protein
MVGEVLRADLAQIGAVAYLGGWQTVLSLVLTPGDWDITGVLWYNPVSLEPVAVVGASLSFVTNTQGIPNEANTGIWQQPEQNINPYSATPVGPVQSTSAASRTVFLTAKILDEPTVAGSGVVWGVIRARRMR